MQDGRGGTILGRIPASPEEDRAANERREFERVHKIVDSPRNPEDCQEAAGEVLPSVS